MFSRVRDIVKFVEGELKSKRQILVEERAREMNGTKSKLGVCGNYKNQKLFFCILV
jgi:hypothetical protein